MFVLQGRPATVVEESPTGTRPSGLNMSSVRTTCSAAPTSPTHYNQPPTPEHPPPSPMTAILGIQEKINPKVSTTITEIYSVSSVFSSALAKLIETFASYCWILIASLKNW